MTRIDTSRLRQAMDKLESAVRDNTNGTHGYEAVIAYRDAVVSAALDLRADAPRTVVEVTGEDMADSDEVYRDYGASLSGISQRRAEFINARLRARAGTVALQWVQRPGPVATSLVVPEDGWYAVEVGSVVLGDELNRYEAGASIPAKVSRIRRIDTDEPTTWIERTPETVSAWTADSCAAFVGKLCTVEYGGVMRTWHNGSDNAADIAQHYNEISAVAVCILPDRPAGAGA